MDIVEINGLSFSAIIGIFDWERKNKQRIIINLKMQSHTALPALTQNIADAVDYKTVSEQLIQKIQTEQYQLLETLCEECTEWIQHQFDVGWILFSAYKPDALNQVEQVGIQIERGEILPKRRVWLSLGSNIERQKHIKKALFGLKKLFGTLVISPIYESEAVGFEGQPFLNLVVGIKTDLPLLQIEKSLKILEKINGRIRTSEKFAPRTLDIDILTWGDEIISQDKLILPKDEILKYAFVLKPLADVAGEELHPILKTNYQFLWKRFAKKSKQSICLSSLQRIDIM